MKKTEKAPPITEEIEAFEDWEEIAAEPEKKQAKASDAQPAEQPKVKSSKQTKEVPPPIADELVGMSADAPVHLVAVIGRTAVSMKDVMNYRMGHVVDLGRPPGETVDLVASGKLFAKGELVDIDGKLGVRIVKIVR